MAEQAIQLDIETKKTGDTLKASEFNDVVSVINEIGANLANNQTDTTSALTNAATAQQTAEGAQSTAEKAQSAATAAQDTANVAQSTAETAQSTANTNATNIAALQEAVNKLHSFDYVVVDNLPTPSASTMYKVYLVPAGATYVGTTQEPTATATTTAEPTPEPNGANNLKDEYVTVNSGTLYWWERLGTKDVDLSGYVTTQAVSDTTEYEEITL